MDSFIEQLEDQALTDVIAERRRQDRLFPDQAPGSPDGLGLVLDDEQMLAVLMEEVGEVAKARLEGESVYDELTQVAAVAIKWMQLRLCRGSLGE